MEFPLDARKLLPNVLLERRRGVIGLHRAGVPVMAICRETGLSWAAVNAAIQLFKGGGEAALAPVPRGKKPGAGRTLSADQAAELRGLLVSETPKTHGMADRLWSLESVAAVVKARFKLSITSRGLQNYLRDWGVVIPDGHEKPLQRCSAEIKKWHADHYPALAKAARLYDQKIYWLNPPVKLDSAFWPDTSSSSGKQKPVHLISISSNQGKLYWSICRGSFRPQKQEAFLRSIMNWHRPTQVFLIRHRTSSFGKFTRIKGLNGSALEMVPTRSTHDAKSVEMEAHSVDHE